MSCDIAVEARLVSFDGSTVLHELEDEANGFVLLDNIPDPEWDRTTGRATAFYMHGSAPTGPPRVVDGQIALRQEIIAATWPEVMTKRTALYDAWNAEPVFYLDFVVEGVTTRYRVEARSWVPDALTARAVTEGRTAVTLVFIVQPFPEVTIA